MGRTGARIAFPAEAGSENWRVPVTRPLLSSRFYTEPNQNHVCASHPAARPGLVRKCCGPLYNMWSQEAFNPSPRTIVTWIPLVYNATVVSGGWSRKWFLSVSGPRGVPAPPLIRALPQSFHSTFAARWMWLGKYSSVSPGPKVVSWHSSCHRLTRNRLREMVCSDNGGSKPYLFAES